MAGPLREGGGLNECATKEKRIVLMQGKKFLWPLSRGGGGLKALAAGPQRKEPFLAASLKT